MAKRYAVEAAGPDGRSTYQECFGPSGIRGRVLAEVDTLDQAIVELEAFGGRRSWRWVYDRLERKKVE